MFAFGTVEIFEKQKKHLRHETTFNFCAILTIVYVLRGTCSHLRFRSDAGTALTVGYSCKCNTCHVIVDSYKYFNATTIICERFITLVVTY